MQCQYKSIHSHHGNDYKYDATAKYVMLKEITLKLHVVSENSVFCVF